MSRRKKYYVFRIMVSGTHKLVGEYETKKEAMAKKREICRSLGYKTARCEHAYITEVQQNTAKEVKP